MYMLADSRVQRLIPMTMKLISNLSVIAHIGRLRLLLFGLIFITLSLAAPYAILKELGAQPFLFDRRLLSWPILAGSVLLLVVYYSCDGLRLYHTIKVLGFRVPKRDIGRLVFINILFSNITPMATGGGFAQIWYLHRHGVPLGIATAATTMRTLLAMAFIFTPTPFLLIIMDPLQGSHLSGRLAFYFGLFACGYLAFFAVVLLRMRWILIVTDTMLRLLHRHRFISQTRLRRWSFRFRREAIRFSRGFMTYLKGPRTDILLSVLYTVLFLFALFSFPALLLWGLDYHIDYLTTIGLLVIATFIMYFAPTPGGSGIAEGVFGLFFSSLIIPAELVLIIVAWRFLTIYLGMLVGVPVTLHEMVKKETCGA